MSTTKHTSFIPMSPELLPRQKLNEVVTVPELPKELAPKVEWLNLYCATPLEPHLESLPFCSAQSGLGHRCITALITTILTLVGLVGCFGTIGLTMEPCRGAGTGY